MFQTLAALAALLVGAALFIAANGLFQTLVSVHLGATGLPLTLTALVLSGYYIGLTIGSVVAPRLIGRVGHIRTFAALAALVSVAALLHLFIPPGIAWMALRAATGFSLAGLFVATESWLNDRAPSNLRGTVFATYMVVNYSALGTGQFLLRLAPPTNFELYVLAAILFSLALIPIAIVRVAPPTVVTPRRLGFAALYTLSPLAMVGCCLIGLMNGAFFSLTPIFARGIGFDVEHVSWLMSSAVFGGLLLQWPIGRLSDRVDRRLVLTGVAGAATVVALGMILGSVALPQLIYVIIAIYGGCAFTLYPLCVANANDFAAAEERVSVSGGLLLAFGVGAAMGPLLAAPLMDLLGPRGLFVFTALIASALTLFAIHRRRKRSSPPVEQRSNFVATAPSPIATAAISPEAGSGLENRDAA